ncbi:Uncharacterized conserved protein YggE, contains kinase-interacting SIMPL domain [Formosa sp. Hel1_31_208]|uniref:outer membrane beta-barrel protein n=1 Tax=Formosa sp. Hel1_31_208 TaxID=1798225 RepID=UPI00087D001C|nr:outer membrane beta-barrel protein [Formosa sp. Hel1_31_208]SDR76727.1 Uncharacterized conserved protein YggE, contains kinase-interacting SIMPL domain [Formosa sp. Hel1_31_208]
MSEKKHIDKLFKEQLKNFEVAPDDIVWEHIERELQKDKRKRKVIPIWWKLVGVAAMLALLFTVGKLVINSDEGNGIELEVVDTEKSNTSPNQHNDSTVIPANDFEAIPVTTKENSEGTYEEPKTDSSKQLTNSDMSKKKSNIANSEVDQKNTTDEKSSIINNQSRQKDAVVATQAILKKDKNTNLNTNPIQNNTVANSSTMDNSINDKKKQLLKKDQSEINKLITAVKNSKTTQVTSTQLSEKEDSNTIIDSSAIDKALKEENAIEKAIAEAKHNEEQTEEELEPLMKRWSVAPNVGPVYFNSLGKGSSIDNQFVDNTKQGEVNVSYGVRGSYALNKKFKIRAGVNRVDLGYSTKNVIAFSRPDASASNGQLKNLKLNDSTSIFISANSISLSSAPEILFTKEQGSIDQQLGFIEVPIELEYSLIDKKIGLNLIGGFSTLFLNNNEVYSVQNNGDRTLMGEATNIKDMSYSANFGIGVNYNISKQLRFNLEPMFKYQINTFNDTSGNFQPFFIGVYTGLSFKF